MNRESIIEKSVSGADISAGTQAAPAQMEKLNAYTRRKLLPEETYVFSVILCDNEVDRDGECFPQKSLEKLAELFIGKTGLFDHNARAKNQSARIFDTAVVTDENRAAAGGETYACLKAWAYMVRSAGNSDLILEIDAGIKKEVSVGCAVGKILCSVCGRDQKREPCEHRKGESYGGIVCHHKLCEPTDAYEWSFVAVPAQRNAGVTKGHRSVPEHGSADICERVMKCADLSELGPADLRELRAFLGEAGELRKAWGAHLEEVRREYVRCMSLARPGLDPAVLEETAAVLSERQLKAFTRACREDAEKALPAPQLAAGRYDAPEGAPKDSQFKI